MRGQADALIERREVLLAVNGGCTSAADVLRAADSACYEAKRRGRSRVEVFESSSRDLQPAL